MNFYVLYHNYQFFYFSKLKKNIDLKNNKTFDYVLVIVQIKLISM